MKLYKYISLNIISLLTIINTSCVILAAYKCIPDNVADVIYLCTRSVVTIILLVFAAIEYHIITQNKNSSNIPDIRNKILKQMHILLFYIGFSIFCLKFIIFCFFPFLLLSLWELPI